MVHRSGAAHGLRQQTHALSLEAVLAKCPQIGGKGELQYHEVADGLSVPFPSWSFLALDASCLLLLLWEVCDARHMYCVPC